MKKNKKYIIIILLTSISTVILSLSYTFAMYVKDIYWEYHLNSKGFYFSSDISEENIVSDWQEDSIYFSITNTEKELITDYDIEYEVSCRVTGDNALVASCHLNGEEKSVITGNLANYESCINEKEDGTDTSLYTKNQCEINNYTWKTQVATKELYFDIATEEDLSEVEVEIEIKSTSPYTKKIKGSYKLYKIESKKVKYSYYDHDKVGRLILTNLKDDNECINIMWDSSKVVVDDYDFISSKTDDEGYINEAKINIIKNDSLELYFYKKSSTELSVEDFNISVCKE